MIYLFGYLKINKSTIIDILTLKYLKIKRLPWQGAYPAMATLLHTRLQQGVMSWIVESSGKVPTLIMTSVLVQFYYIKFKVPSKDMGQLMSN